MTTSKDLPIKIVVTTDQLIKMADLHDYFNDVLCDRWNKLGITKAQAFTELDKTYAQIEEFCNAEVAKQGGSYTATSLPDIMRQAIDTLRINEKRSVTRRSPKRNARDASGIKSRGEERVQK